MKGHMQDGKFHPHTQFKKGVRKSRDQKAKTKGVIRKDRAFDNSGKVVGHATWTGHGRGFGHSYGWQVPDGAFHVIDKRNIPESLRPNGGVEISSGKFKGKILDLKDGKIHFEHLKGVCNFCGKRGFDVRKGCPNNCGKILRDDKGQITAIVGSNFVRNARESDSGGIPPEKIFDKERLTKHDGRYFLIAEGYPDTLAIDEYEKVNDNLFKLKRNILFSQSGEETEELLRVTGGGGKLKHVGGFGLVNEKKFLDGLDRSGALQESNFVS